MRTGRVTQEHIAEFERHGYVLIRGFLTAQELQDCQRSAARYFPDSDELAATPERYAGLRKVVSFPFAEKTFNRITVHPELLAFLAITYRGARLRLGESALQVKYGTRYETGIDQPLHNDTWGKKSLAYPRDDGVHRQTFMILYYTDVTEGHAPTHIVSQEHTRGMDLLTDDGETLRTPEDHPELYEKEVPIHADAGSLLIFTGSTLHRGTAMTSETGRRLAHFITYHAAQATWMENLRWPSGERPRPDAHTLRRFIEEARPEERELIGFPSVEDSYWNSMTLRGMAARYPKMDMNPYREAFSRRASEKP